MKPGLPIWLVAGCVFGLVACQPETRSPVTPSPQAVTANDEARVAGEYLLVTRPGTAPAILRQAFSAFRPRRLEALGANRWLIVLEADPGPQAMAQVAAQHAAILDCQPNYRYRQQRLPGRGAPR